MIKGLFDSGADHTCLRMEWKERLRVPDSECFELELTGICGKDNPIVGLATILHATLDGQRFKLPVTFVREVPTDLFGRSGLVERFNVALEAGRGLTTFEWSGAQAPMAEQFEKAWKGKIAQTSSP